MARKNESVNPKTVFRLTISLIGVMFLFGLTWLFGALTISVQGVRLAFQLLFAIFASSQGFFIFVFFCVLNREVRDLWKEALSCGRYKSTHTLKNTSAADKYRKPKSDKNGDISKSMQTTATTLPSTSEILATTFSEKDGPSNHYENPKGAEIEIDEAKCDEDMRETNEVKTYGGTQRDGEEDPEQVGEMEMNSC